MSAGASISGIGGLFYMVMLVIGICTGKGKKLKNEQIYYAIILFFSFTLFMGFFFVLFEYKIVDIQWYYFVNLFLFLF
jgi:hypothetical protein